MKFLGVFDPTVTVGVNGIANGNYIGIGVADPGQKVLFTNLAPVNIILNFEDGNSDILHAGQANVWTLDNITPTIEWSQQKVLNVSGAPINQCSVVLYNADEKVNGVYPTSLVYFNVIGNVGGVNTTVSGTGTDLINDGQAVGHTYIESTPITQSTSSFTLTNDGQLLLRALIGGTTYAQQFKTQLTGNSPLIGSATNMTEILGNVTVDGTTTLTGATTSGAIGATNISASGTLAVTSTSTFTGLVTANGGVGTTNVTASGTISVTGNTTIGGTLSVTGTIRTASGNYYGADAANTVLSTSGTTGTGITRLQSTDHIVLQIPQGTPQIDVLAGATSVHGSLTVDNGFVGSSSGSFAGSLTITGATIANSTLSVAGTTFVNVIDMQSSDIKNIVNMRDSGGNTFLSVTASSNTRVQSSTTISMQVPIGSTVATFTSAGLNIASGKTLNLSTGSFTAVSSGSSVMSSAGTVITHNLGTTPDIVILQTQSGSSTATTGYDTVGATTFKGYNFSSLNTKWIAIKF